MRNVASNWWTSLFSSTLPNRRTRRAAAARNRQRTAFVADALERRRVFTLPVATIWTETKPPLYEGTSGYEFHIGFGQLVSEDTTVNLSFGGDAEFGVDYTIYDSYRNVYLTGPSVVIEAEYGGTFLMYHALNDNFVEGTEDFSITLLEGDNYTVGSPDSQTFEILDDDEPEIRIDATEDEAFEASGRDARFTVSKNTEGTASVVLTFEGEADPGDDYLVYVNNETTPRTLSSGNTLGVNFSGTGFHLRIVALGDSEVEDLEDLEITISTVFPEHDIVKASDDATIADSNLETGVSALNPHGCTCFSCSCTAANAKPDYATGQNLANARTGAGQEMIYSGSSAAPRNLAIQLDIPQGFGPITKFSVGGQVGGSWGLPLGSVFFGGTGDPRGKSHYANFQVPANGLAIGLHAAEIDVTYYFENGQTATHTQTVEYLHLDGTESEFGAGWRPRGFSRLYVESSGLLFDFGDGNVAYFRETSSGIFKADPSPFIHFSAEIVENPDGTYTYDDGHRNLQQFRADGYLTERIDRDGNVTEYIYSDLDSDSVYESLTSIVDPAGRATTLQYQNGKIWKMVGIDGAVSEFAHDTAGRLISITEADPDGGGPLTAPSSTFTYVGSTYQLASITNAEGQTVSYSYDANGYLASITETGPSSETITTEYEMYFSDLMPDSGEGTATTPRDYALSHLQSTKKIDHDGKVTEYFFNRFGQANKIVHFDGTITESTFSEDGLLLESIDLDPDGAGPLTDRVTTYTYDSNGNVTSITYADDSTETFTYNLEFNEVTSYTDQLGHVTLYERDATYGRVTSTTRVMGDVDDSINLETDDAVVAVAYTQSSGGVKGLIETITDAEGNVTKFIYDAYGRVGETIFAFGTADASSETFEYDTGDRVTAHEDGLGRRTDFVYDGLGRLIETIHPDLNASDAYDPVSTFYIYNKLGYLIAVTSPVSQNPSNGAVTSRTIETIYEDNFYRVRNRRPDHEGDVDTTPTDTVVQYDWLGRPVTSTDELGNVTTYQYDSVRRLQKIVSADPDGGGSQTASEIAYGYNERGWLVSETDALGKVTNYEYDVMGRVTKILRPELSPGVRATEEFIYDDAGQLVESIDAMGESTIYAYDDFGRLISTTSPDPDGTGGSQTASVLTFEYDENDNLVSETDALGNVTTYEYDAKNRLVKVTEADPDGTSNPQTAPETTFVYDDADQLLYTIDAIGRRADFEYDAWGRLVKTTLPDPDGAGSATRPYRQTTYDLAGRVTSETDATGAVTTYEYDALDNLKKVTQADPDGPGSGNPLTSPETLYAYDAAGQLLSKTDPRGAVTTYAYDALGRVTSITQADPATGSTHVTNSPVTRFEYDKNGRLAKVIDALLGETVYAYDAMGRRTSVTQPDPDGTSGSQSAPVTAFTYDLAGRLLTETDALARVTAYAYDALGRVTSVTEPDPDGASSQTSPVTAFTYDKNGRVLTETDALGRVTRYAYDNLGRLLTVTQPDPDGASTAQDAPVTTYAYDAVGQRTSVTDPLNRTTTYAYNGLGQLSSVTQPDPDGSGGNPAPVTSYTYDAEGRLLTKTDPDSRNPVTQYEYDALGRLIKRIDPDPDKNGTVSNGPLASPITLYEYDAAGNLTKVTDPLNRSTTYAYDYLGRQTSVTAPDPDGAGTGQAAAVTSYGYDKLGRRTSVTDPRSKTTDYAYDALGRLTKQELPDPDGGGSNGRPTTLYTYDAVGNLLSLTDPEGNVHAYEYDGLDRLITQTDPLLEDTVYEYDAVGNVTKMIDRRGLVTEYVYDDLNRRTAEIWKNGSTTVNQIDYVYDEASQLVSASDNWSAYAYTYDSLGRVTSVDNDGTFDVPRVVLTNAFATNLKRSSVSATIGGTADFKTTYAYDALGRLQLQQQTAQSGGNTVAAKEFYWAYRADSSVDTMLRNASTGMTDLVMATLYLYDEAGRVTFVKNANFLGDLAEHQYTYDIAGRETSHVKLLFKGGNYLGSETISSSYDDTNQLTGTDYSTTQTDESYTYDENGNRVGAGITIDDGNRVVAEGGFAYEYDENGNRTKRTNTSTGAYQVYAWDHRNRLTSIAIYGSGGTTPTKRIFYYYDVFDRRIAEEIDATADGTVDVGKRWVYDSEGKQDANGHPIDDVVLVFDHNGNLLHRYVHGPEADQILAEENVSTGVVTWPLSDKVGTIHDRVTYDFATDRMKWHTHIWYDSFGRVIKQTDGQTGATIAASDSRSYSNGEGPTYGFQGREWEADASLYYHRARWYDPQLRRFISEDPIFDDTTNTYRYVGNAPTDGRDPSGFAEFNGQELPRNIDNPGGVITVLPVLIPKYVPNTGIAPVDWWLEQKRKFLNTKHRNPIPWDRRNSGIHPMFICPAPADEVERGFKRGDPNYTITNEERLIELGSIFAGLRGWAEAVAGGGGGGAIPKGVPKVPPSMRPPIPRPPISGRPPLPGKPGFGSGARPSPVQVPRDWTDFDDEAARIMRESAIQRGIRQKSGVKASQQTRLVKIDRLIYPETRYCADPAKVERLGAFNSTRYQPIIVETDGINYWLVDGATRVEIARRAGIKELPAYVYPRTK